MIKFLDLEKINNRFRSEIDRRISSILDRGWYLQGNATAVLLSLIRDGNGVSLHPIGSASREKDLVFLSELGYEEEHDFWIATRKDYVQRPEVKVLIECIRDATLKI